MESFSHSVRPLGGCEVPENILRIEGGERTSVDHPARDNALARKGQAVLDLIHEVADTMSAKEKRIEAALQQILDQIKGAEDRNRVLTVRVTQAESRASEAVKWLKRLHDEIEAKFAQRNGLSWAAQ